MPQLDGTGPTGAGPMTGRKMGPCADGSGYGCPAAGRGHRGFGFRRFWVSPKNSLRDLKDEEAQLKEELAALKDEIAAVEKQVQNK